MSRASLDYERTSGGALTYVRVSGTIDESFDGREAARRIRSTRALINLAGLRLITSFGLREWLKFAEELQSRKIQIFYAQCSPKFVEELNHVVGLADKGTVLSVYAPYECPECRATRSILLRLDKDADVIRSRQPPSFTCLSCGGGMEFDDNPAAYFPPLVESLGTPFDEIVLEFLEARLGYGAETERQLHIQKLIIGDTTVIWFGGTLGSTLNGPKLAEGLEGTVILNLADIIHVQQPGIRAWRDFIAEASVRSKLLLVDSPALVIERALEGLDNQAGLDVLSVRIPYECGNCGTTEFVSLDLAGRVGGEVRQGRLPERKCGGCGADAKAMVGVALLAQLMKLPAPNAPDGVQKTLRKAAKQIKANRAVSKRPQRRPSSALVLASAVAILLGVSAAVGASYFLRNNSNSAANTKPPEPTAPTDPKPPTKEFERPDWITSDERSSSYCLERGQTLSCVGVSSYHAKREDAEREGFEAAVEALVHATTLNVQGRAAAAQRATYMDARTSALEALEQARYDGDLAQPLAFVQAQRANIADALRRQRPPGAPTQRSSWYWEEYESETSNKSEFLVFVRVDASRNERKALSRFYTTPIRVEDSQLLPAHPCIGWSVELGGKTAFLVQRIKDGALRDANVDKGDLLLVSGQVGADELPKLISSLSKGAGDAKVSVRRGAEFTEVRSLWTKN